MGVWHISEETKSLGLKASLQYDTGFVRAHLRSWFVDGQRCYYCKCVKKHNTSPMLLSVLALSEEIYMGAYTFDAMATQLL